MRSAASAPWMSACVVRCPDLSWSTSCRETACDSSSFCARADLALREPGSGACAAASCDCARAASASNGRGSIENSRSPLRTSAPSVKCTLSIGAADARPQLDVLGRLEAAAELLAVDHVRCTAGATLTGRPAAARTAPRPGRRSRSAAARSQDPGRRRSRHVPKRRRNPRVHTWHHSHSCRGHVPQGLCPYTAACDAGCRSSQRSKKYCEGARFLPSASARRLPERTVRSAEPDQAPAPACSSRTGRTSTLPWRAGGMRAAISIASFRSRASTR